MDDDVDNPTEVYCVPAAIKNKLKSLLPEHELPVKDDSSFHTNKHCDTETKSMCNRSDVNNYSVTNGAVHGDEKIYYTKAKKYWSEVQPTVDGMLGGYGQISFTDITGSSQFLKDLYKMRPSPGRECALDCGAGIGRVSKFLLLPIFNKVDLAEQDEKFCLQAKEYIGNDSKLGEIYNVGLQEFTPERKKYDVIWAQWVLAHLTDNDLIDFFKRSTSGLKKDGFLIMKENISSGDAIENDNVDSSATRPLKLMKSLIAKGNLKIVKIIKQNNFPKGLFPVYMIAMRPIN